MTLQEIIDKINANIDTTGNNLTTGAGLIEVLLDMINASFNAPGEATTSLPAYSTTTNYTVGLAVFFNNAIWVSLEENGPDSTIVEPGTNEDVWVALDPFELAHLQNTDFKLGRHIKRIGPGDLDFGVLNLTWFVYRKSNYFIFGDTQDQLSTDFNVSLKTVDGSSRYEGFFWVINEYQNATVTINFDGNTEIPGLVDLNLAQGDWALCLGAVEMNGGRRTQVVASNKLTGTGGGGNPFDQDLNTTNNVEFNALKLPPLSASAGEKKNVVVDDAGNQESTAMADLTTTPLSQITMYDEVLEANVTYKSINGVWTAI